MSKNTRKTIIHLLANEIRNTMQTITLPYIDKYSFETIKTLTTLIDELLSDSIVKKEYVDKLSKSNESENAKNIEEKLETFQMIRNLIIHFPFFKSWDDIYINYSILNWNNPTSRIKSIQKYFDDNKGKRMIYKVYTRLGDNWRHEHTIDFIVPALYKNKKVYLKDIISADDMFWTFSLIDSLLEYLGIGIMTFSHYSI